jgi:hypothetical protein
MSIWRVPVPLVFAFFLAGCASHIPVLEAPDDVSTATAQPDRTLTAKVKLEAKKVKLQTKPKPVAAPATPNEDTTNSTTPMVGSPQKWEKERAEDERKEQQLKKVIEEFAAAARYSRHES